MAKVSVYFPPGHVTLGEKSKAMFYNGDSEGITLQLSALHRAVYRRTQIRGVTLPAVEYAASATVSTRVEQSVRHLFLAQILFFTA